MREVDRFGKGRASKLVSLGLFLAVTVVAACGSSSPPAVADQVDATTYTAVISRFVPPPIDPDDVRVVYVAGVGPTEMSLEDQVSVIDGFADTHEIRFVDDVAAAIDGDLPGSPPRDDGVLIGVGKLTIEPPYTVRVEVYTDADRIEAQLVTVVRQNGDWIVESVEPVEPEVLLADE